MALAPLSDVNAGRVRHPDGEADRRSRAKGERRERRAGRYSCRRRPGRGSGPETGTSPGSSACLAPPADGHAGERRGRADRHCAAVNGCPKRPSPYPASRWATREVKENARGAADLDGWARLSVVAW